MPWQNTTGKRLYVTADRSRVVDADDPAGAFLLVGEGGEVSDEDAARYGLKALEKPAETKAVEAPPATKGEEPPRRGPPARGR